MTTKTKVIKRESPALAPTDGTEAGMVESSIHVIRGKRVMLDRDLAGLYGVSTRTLNQAVKRNLERFPEDFCFQLTPEETEELASKKAQFEEANAGIPYQYREALRSQIVISKLGQEKQGGRRYLPYAFTEHGVTMLSAVLKSKQAVAVSLAVVRAFIRLRQMAAEYATVLHRLETVEVKAEEHDKRLGVLAGVLEQFLEPEEPVEEEARRPIGFTGS